MGYQGNYPPSTPLNPTQLGTGVVTTDAIADGAVVHADLSTGGPYWDTSGNVGIGTTSPSSSYRVQTYGQYPGLGIQTNQANGGTGGGWIDFLTVGGTVQGNIYFNQANGYMSFGTAASAAAAAERMRIDSSGNVGIGTSSPGGSRLYVAQAGSAELAIRSTDVGAWKSRITFGNASAKWEIGTDIGSAGNNNLYFYDIAAGSERMRIDSSGRITAPFQPAFNATIPYTTTASLWPDNNANFVNYVSVSLNRGSSFNATTGLFTAPVSGAYRFVAVLTAESSVELNDYQLAVNNSANENYSTPIVLNGPNPGWKNGTLSSVLNLNANDTVSVRRTCCNNNKPGALRMTFSGELIG